MAANSINLYLRVGKVAGVRIHCPYYPCHERLGDCTWCYCPFYPCDDESTGGKTMVEAKGRAVFSCQDCEWIHQRSVANLVLSELLKVADEIERIPRPILEEIRLRVLKLTKERHAKVLMIQGTSSHSGKTLLTLALCRVFSDCGYETAPFKAQNMSLNSAVTRDGSEIARAQALQALAAGVEPVADMNPILLKPKGDKVSQVILQGKPYKDMSSKEYFSSFALNDGIRVVRAALGRLVASYDVVVVEGAGNPTEVNLYEVDIANMQVADMADAPVILTADIDRGGAFSSLVGTLQLLKPSHRGRVKGLVLNRFRGDYELLKPGLPILEKLTGKPVLGVVPRIEGLKLPHEDSVSLDGFGLPNNSLIDIAVIRFPRFSNFTDFDALRYEPSVGVRLISIPQEVGCPDVVILPGTKNTVEDLKWLVQSGLAEGVVRLASEGKPMVGICGGYQMLGKVVEDVRGVEGGYPAKG